MVKLIIFDLDGTLVNSVEDLADAANMALADNGYDTYPTDSYYHFVGNGTKKLIERTLPKGTPPEEQERIHDIFSVNYRKCCLNKTRPYDGMTDTLKELKSLGFKCAVASNKPDGFSKQIVHALFGKSQFDLIRGKTDETKAKPAPDIIFWIMDAFGVTADETILVGDSDVDVITAKNAGIKCIGCEWGFRGKEELAGAGTDFMAETPEQIVKIICN